MVYNWSGDGSPGELHMGGKIVKREVDYDAAAKAWEAEARIGE